MNFNEFQDSISRQQKPTGLSAPLMALWYDAQDDWGQAHDYAQRLNDSASAWVHAYLHRKEGDVANANYWYVRAGRTLPAVRLEEEWREIATTLLSKE